MLRQMKPGTCTDSVNRRAGAISAAAGFPSSTAGHGSAGFTRGCAAQAGRGSRATGGANVPALPCRDRQDMSANN